MPRSRTRKNKPPSRPRLTHTGRVSDHAEPATPATLTEAPHLSWPTAAVRDSYLAGERENSLADGNSLDWMDGAAADFGAYVRQRRGIRTRWDVPSTLYWYVAGREYLGTLVIRHRLPGPGPGAGHL
jgi:hypothetical protein